MRKLLIRVGKITHDYEVNCVKDLKEGIKDVLQMFLPEEDQFAPVLYEEGDYDGVLGVIEINYIGKNQLYYDAEKVFEVLKRVDNMNTYEEIIDEFKNFNDVFKEIDCDTEIMIEE